jgi:two-component system response regulator FlrC
MMPRILIVEDDPTLRMALRDTLETAEFQVFEAENGKEGLLQLMHQDIDVVVSDVQMDEMDGEQLLRATREKFPSIPFVMMTAHASVERAVAAMRDGATDYLQKPFEAASLVETVKRMVKRSGLDASEMIAKDAKTKEILAIVDRVAPSARSESDFVALNCAAIPENMLEAILFGYEKGAFTGATVAREGKFEQANGGTLLLDEISEMALELQAKLLRVLQEQEVERLGGKTTIPLDVRVLATTNRNLVEEVADGRFREDLYFRLNVFPIDLPPLRKRVNDIIPLACRFIERFGGGKSLSLSEDAKSALISHRWRGNIRELGNCIHRACILASGSVIERQDIIFDALVDAGSVSTATVSSPDVLKTNERELILSTLKDTNGNRKIASERLGISGRTLRYKLAKFKEQGIEVPDTSIA